jgi:O-antigen/teichoic acid export membrane protein
LRPGGVQGDAAPAGAPHFASHFVESVLLTWVSNLARIAIGMLALRLVTDAIPEAELGAYWILTSVASLLSSFADLGIGLGAVRHLPLAPDREQARRLMHTIVLLRVAVLVLLCLLLLACKPLILNLFDAESIARKYHFLYVFVLVTSLGELYNNFLQGLNRFRAMAVFALVSSLARLVLIVVFVRGMHLGVDGLFLSEAVSLALAAGLSAWATGHGPRLAFDRTHGRQQLRFGFPLYLNTLLSYTANRINTVLVGSMSGTVAVSWFTVAARVPDQLSIVLRAYNLVYLPNMSRLLADGDRQPARRLLAASLRLMSFCFALLTLLLTYFRHELLAILAPPSYQVAAPAVPLLAGSVAFAALGSIMGSTLVALGDSRTPVKINIWTSLISFALNYDFIQRWGFMGAAWAAFVFNVVAYAITDAVLSRRLAPAGRSYLGILLYLAALLVLGLRAGLLVRSLLLVAAAGGSLALSPSLRADVLRVWSLRRRPRAPGGS